MEVAGKRSASRRRVSFNRCFMIVVFLGCYLFLSFLGANIWKKQQKTNKLTTNFKKNYGLF
jgi:hypothetical protein